MYILTLIISPSKRDEHSVGGREEIFLFAFMSQQPGASFAHDLQMKDVISIHKLHLVTN